MGSIEYKEPKFIWHDEIYGEFEIADISWIINDECSEVLNNPLHSSSQNLYQYIMTLIQKRIKKGNSGIFFDLISIGRILEKAKNYTNVDVLYIGEKEESVHYICEFIRLLVLHHAVFVNRCTCTWQQKSKRLFYYGYSSKICIQEHSSNINKDSKYDLIIWDLDQDYYNFDYDNIIELMNKESELIVYSKNKKKINTSYGTIFGDVDGGYWQCIKEIIPDDELLLSIRKAKKSKLYNLLDELMIEAPYINAETFEDEYFLACCKKMLKEYSSEDDVNLFADNQNKIRNYIDKIIKRITELKEDGYNLRLYPDKLLDFIKDLDSTKQIVKKTDINRNSSVGSKEYRVEFIVRNNLINNGVWEYHDDKEKLHFYNWYPAVESHDTVEGCVDNIKYEWLYRFIKKYIPNRKKELNFYSVQGDDLRSRFMNRINKIFYFREDASKRFINYIDSCAPNVDLVISYKEINDCCKSIKFPMWISANFEPDMDISNITKQIDVINNARSSCKYECAWIASHDRYKSRIEALKILQSVLKINCPGKFNHNTNELKDEYNDDKRAYLREHQFCVCMENVNAKDYITEKLIDAFMCGSIPIYYGAHNEPQPEIFNQKSILFYNPAQDNTELKEKITILKSNLEVYNEFMNQKKLLEGSDEYIYDCMVKLKDGLKQLCI